MIRPHGHDRNGRRSRPGADKNAEQNKGIAAARPDGPDAEA
jgi:hypothetical protein